MLMKTKISVLGAEFYAYHGYYPEERLAGNTFIIDADVETEYQNTEDDDILHTVNYENIYNICKEEMLFPRKLLETVAARIAKRLKNTYPHIITATVRIRKIGPQLGGKVQQTVVEMSI
jgi:7,8-dihydroneopterin aldolase/epimerase/oxygenase